MKLSQMFDFITHTVNPLGGGPCPYQCTYCWASELKNRHKWEKYKGPWRIYEKELKQYKPGDFVFPFDMIDIGCPSIPSEIIHKLLSWMRKQPKVKFLLLTKNPEFYITYGLWIPINCVLGATIETDIEENISKFSKAPSPSERIENMKYATIELPLHDTFISIEPIMKFSPLFANQLSNIRPWAVAIGYDNYKTGLIEPELSKVMELLSELDKYTLVFIKTLRESLRGE